MKSDNSILAGHRQHPRRFEDSAYVYPVLSRRSGGISIGINLNPNKICNMDCVYCQVDRHSPPVRRDVDLARLKDELSSLAEDTLSGALFNHPRFSDTPPALRRLNDFAFSGDGEPTTFKPFDSAVEVVVDVKAALGLDDVKIVLITDSGCLHQEHVKAGLRLMDANHGVIWAKLDAGTEGYYRQINRTNIPFKRVLRNIELTASVRPIIIQSLFMEVNGAGPGAAEIDAYIGRLRDVEKVGDLAEIHLYTIARVPAETWVKPLSNEALDALTQKIKQGVRSPVRTFYGG